MRSPNRPWLLSWLLLYGACEGTSTGNPTMGDGPGEETANGGQCKETSAMELALDAETALGVSANDVLALAEGTHEEILTWHEQDGAVYGPESGAHGLTLQVMRKGAPRLVHYEAKSNGLGEIALAGLGCSDALEIPVELGVKTDQGALNEVFTTKLVARNAREASIFVSPDPAKLTGSFAVTSVSVPGTRLAQLSFGVVFSEYGTRGSLTGVFELRQGDSVSAAASRNPLANWGPASCDYYGSPVPTSARINGYSADDVLALLNREQTASVTFDGNAASQASVMFSQASERACAVLDGTGTTIGGPGSLRVQASLRIKSADERLDATWPVGVSVMPGANGEIGSIQITFDDERVAQTGSATARYGVSGVDTSAFDSFGASLMLSASPASAMSGELTLTGYKNAQCAPVVMTNSDGSSSSGGCPGATPTRIAHARIAASATP